MIDLKKSWDVMYRYKDPIILIGSAMLACFALGLWLGFTIATPKQTDQKIIRAFAVELHRECNKAEVKGLKRAMAQDANCRKLSEWAEKRIGGK